MKREILLVSAATSVKMMARPDEKRVNVVYEDVAHAAAYARKRPDGRDQDAHCDTSGAFLDLG
jgi:hypothetical protein